MSRTVRINATLDAELLRRIDEFAQGRQEDRSTAIRQLADIALREVAKQECLHAYRQARITLRDLAARLGLSVWAAHDLLTSEGIAIAQGAAEETADAVDELMKQLA